MARNFKCLIKTEKLLKVAGTVKVAISETA